MKEKTKHDNKNINKYLLIGFKRIVNYIQKLLYGKYFVSKISYQKSLIKNIIYDDKKRIVSVFKEQLIINDTSEYMKRYYKKHESFVRLKKYYEIYEEFSKVFPNYTPLSEAKYIYINIHKKQKILDLQQDQANNWKLKLKKNSEIKNRLRNDRIFSNDVYQSIEKNSEYLNSEIFGIKKDESNSSLIQLKNIINSIDKYELNLDNIDFSLNSKNEKEIKNKNIIINNYYYNNNSILAKKIHLESIFIQPKNNFLNGKNFSIIKNNILSNLKKPKIKIISYKNANSYQLNNTKQNLDVKINNVKNNISGKTLNKNKKIRYKNKNKNKSVVNSNQTNSISNYIKYALKNKKNINKKIKDKKNSNIMPHTSRISGYKNIKLNNIVKSLLKSNDNNLLSAKSGNKLNKNKSKINHSLINKIINNKTSNILTERGESNLESPKYPENSNIRTTNHRTNRKTKSDYNKLNIHLEAIIKKEHRKSQYIKSSFVKNKNSKNKGNSGLNTDRGIYYLNNLKKMKKKSFIRGNIKTQSKESSKNKKNINKMNFISNLFLTNANTIKNKHERRTSEKTFINTTKFASLNIKGKNRTKKDINNNDNKMNSKVKIKAIQIKNFNQIFKVNKEKSNGSYLKTSERSKIIGTNNKKIINKKLMLQKYNKIANNNIISYTEREKAKRLFFSNNL